MGDNPVPERSRDCAHVRQIQCPQAVAPPAAAPPSDKELVLKVIPMPADTNGNGDIFGGWVMAQVDLAGSVLPARIIRGRMATVAVNEFVFKQPVRVGDILSFYSSVTRIGNTSITVDVEVYAERFRAQGAVREGDGGAADLRGDRRRGQAAAGAAVSQLSHLS